MSFQETLMSILTAVITACVPVLVTYLITFIKSKTNDLKAKTNSEVARTCISSVDDLITTIVISLSQTIVETAKKNGTFTKELGEQVFEQAKQQVLTALNDESKELISKLYNMTVEQYVENKVEAAVNQTKM